MYPKSEECCGIDVGEILIVSNGLIGDMAFVNIQTLHQSRIGLTGGFCAHVCDSEGIGERCAG